MTDLRKAAEMALLLVGLLSVLPLAVVYLTGHALGSVAGVFVGMAVIKLMTNNTRTPSDMDI